MEAINESKAVGRLCEILALAYGEPPHKARQIRIAASLHDVGKQRIKKAILDKPGKLTPQEFEVVKTHTILGAEMLSGLEGELGKMARDCAMWHHEWHNGSGYWGKRMGDLPQFVAFTAISDVFCALIHRRCYKEPWPPREAMDYIQKQAGTQFSHELAEVFLWLVQYDSRVTAIFNRR